MIATNGHRPPAHRRTGKPAHALARVALLLWLVLPASGAAATCGDGLLEADETCAACAADCVPATCAAGPPHVVRVTLQVPEESKLTAATVRLAYRSDVLRLPREQGERAVRSRLTLAPQPTVATAADEGYAVRVVVVRDPIESGPLFDIRFDRCAEARLATAADLSCVVEGCAGLGGPVSGCTCAVNPER
jgi:hypothetical protein